jgi:membrane-associated phospholipid phosphatase
MASLSKRSALFLIAAASTALAAAGFLGLDGALTPRGEAAPAAAGRVLALLDLLALKEISNFLLGFMLLVAAGTLLAGRRTHRTGWSLLYLGLVQFVATTIADLAKPVFGRLRPFEASAGDVWFVGANSFPSGHTAFYAGLFFPLIFLLPRAAWLWVLLPLFVAALRVLQHDHYLSDVAASLALAAALAAALSPLVRRGRPAATG